MNKAIFLDRDGVLIQERGEYNWLAEHIRILPGSAEALLHWQKEGYMLIVITNQGGIAKGLYSHSRVQEIHAQLSTYYTSHGVQINAFYYCPHHPEFTECLCRKPGSLMLEKAMARYQIDAKISWFIGDNARDISAGDAAGVPSILIPSNADLRELIGTIK